MGLNAPGCARFSTHGAEVAICGKTTQARQNGPGARPGASSILGVAYTIFGSDRGMAIGLT
jgi:hypothetical protein